jgi:hypothetical protein
MAEKKRFSWKAFTTLYIVLSGAIITVTGLVLYLSPPGRVAHWVEWRFIGLTKEQWQALHTIFAFVFVVAALVHLYFNWPIFWSYLKHRLQAGLRMKRETGLATLFTLGFFFLTLLEVPPFSSVIALGEYLTQSWSNEQSEPPVPHAEELTVAQYARAVGMSVDQVVERLTAAGIAGVDTSAVLGDLAEVNASTPKALADLVAPSAGGGRAGGGGGGGGGTGAGGQGGGWGRMTVQQLCEREGVPLETGLARLAAAGIPAKGGDNLRVLAQAHDREAYELAPIVRGGKQE